MSSRIRSNPAMAKRQELRRDSELGHGKRIANLAKASGQGGLAIGVVLGAYQLIGYAYGCGYNPSPMTAVTSAWDPDGDIVAQAFELGIGVVELRATGNQRVLVINDRTYARVPMPLPGYHEVVVDTTRPVVLPVTGDPGGATITCYPVRPL